MAFKASVERLVTALGSEQIADVVGGDQEQQQLLYTATRNLARVCESIEVASQNGGGKDVLIDGHGKGAVMGSSMNILNSPSQAVRVLCQLELVYAPDAIRQDLCANARA